MNVPDYYCRTPNSLEVRNKFCSECRYPLVLTYDYLTHGQFMSEMKRARCFIYGLDYST